MTTTELTERRELADRTNDGIDVTLLWSKASNRVTISVFRARSPTALELEVDGATRSMPSAPLRLRRHRRVTPHRYAAG
jgi:hypothetical protein